MFQCDARFVATRTFFDELQQQGYLSHADIADVATWGSGVCSYRGSGRFPPASRKWFSERFFFNSGWKYFECRFETQLSWAEEECRVISAEEIVKIKKQCSCDCNWCILRKGVWNFECCSRGPVRQGVKAALPPIVKLRAREENRVAPTERGGFLDLERNGSAAPTTHQQCLEIFAIRRGERDSVLLSQVATEDDSDF